MVKVTAQRKATMAWVADQGEYIARLARQPWAGDNDNVANIRAELEKTLRALPDPVFTRGERYGRDLRRYWDADTDRSGAFAGTITQERGS